MRDFGKVHTSFWTSTTVRDMSEDGRTLAIYLLTSPHGTIAGVFRLPDGYACDDMKWETPRVRQAFAELQKHRFAWRCEATSWVWVIDHFKWNPLENPNQKKAASKVANQVPHACRWAVDFFANCGPIFHFEGAPRNPLGTVPETLPEPFRNQEQEQEQEKTSIVPGLAEDIPQSAKTKASSARHDAEGILVYLNEKVGRGYKPVPANISLITGRLNEGATVEECKAVVDAKVTAWQGDPKMRDYLRPATLFNALKFANYVGELAADAAPAEKEWE
jgi:uncharacterized phage protein (TIGR02220 family)